MIFFLISQFIESGLVLVSHSRFNVACIQEIEHEVEINHCAAISPSCPNADIPTLIRPQRGVLGPRPKESNNSITGQP